MGFAPTSSTTRARSARAALCVDLLNEIVAGVDGIVTAVHLCRRNKARQGWIGEGGYDPILPFLPRLAVRQYVLELTIPVAGDFAILRRLPDDRKGSAAETPIDEAYAKLRNEAAAAALLRERHP